MDIRDIDKIVIRKQIKDNTVQIRDKLCQENAKIIQLKVAQDTSYWDLKETLSQLQGNHERLQQNMVELQMQYETVSMKFQDELRQRQETLNKVNSTMAMVEEIQKYVTKLNDTGSRTRSDVDALAASFTSASIKVRDLLDKYIQMQRTQTDEARELSRLKEQLLEAKTTNENCDIVNQIINALRNQHSELVQKHEETILSLNSEVKRLRDEKNAQKCDLQGVIADYKIKSVEEARCVDELRAKVRAADECVTMLREQLDAAERERNLLQQLIDKANNELQEFSTTMDTLNRSLLEVKEENQKFAETITEKDQIVNEAQSYIDTLTNEVATLNIKHAETEAALNTAQEEKQAEVIKIEQMTQELEAIHKELVDMKEEFKKYKEETNSKSVSAGNMISSLLVDVQAAFKTVDEKNAEIHTLKVTAAAEQDSLRLEETRQRSRADNLESIIKNKDKEIAELKINTINKEKEIDGLKATIGAMQSTINNIQKELTGRLLVGLNERDKTVERPERLEREQQHKLPESSIQRISPPPENIDIYSFLSNSSSESEVLPREEINRRYDTLKKRTRDVAINEEMGKGKLKVSEKILEKAKIPRRGQSPIFVSVSEVKNDLTTRKRALLKNKNTANKLKKMK